MSVGPTTRCASRPRTPSARARSSPRCGRGSLSPESELVAAQFAAAAARLPELLAGLASGRELITDGYGADVDLAAAHDVSPAAPRLVDGVLVG